MCKKQGLLTQGELELLAKIDASVRCQFNGKGNCNEYAGDDSKTGKFIEQVSTMEENLKNVMDLIGENKVSVTFFVEMYSEWKKNRKKTIAKLKQIAKSLDKDRFNFNIAKMFGYCLALAGGATLVASGLNVDLGTNLDIAGGTLTVTGTSIVLGTSITETVRLARKVKKAKKLIQKDQAYFQHIRDWLDNTDELQEALINVLNIDIVQGVTDSLKRFVRKALKIKKDHKRLKFIEKSVKGVIGLMGKESHDVPVAVIATYIKTFTTVLILLCKTENRLVFDFASVALRSVTVVSLLVENSVEAFGLAAKLAADSAQVLKVATGVVGLTLDAIGIAKTAADIHKKSRSPEAKKINLAAASLSDDFNTLSNVYKSLIESEERIGNVSTGSST